MSRLRNPLHITIKPWAAVALAILIAVSCGAGVTLYGRQGKRLNTETNHRIDAGRLSREQNDYELCTRIDGILVVITNVVESAFSGTVSITPAEVALLPPSTRHLLEELEPVLRDSSRETAVRKSTVLAKVPGQQDCGNPPPGETTTVPPSAVAPPPTG